MKTLLWKALPNTSWLDDFATAQGFVKASELHGLAA